MRNQKGVTLTILVITILILSIVVATTANIGVDVIKSSKFERFKTELKIMQTQVNDNYDKYKNEGKNEILTLGAVADGSEKAFQEGESGITSAEGYRLWDQDVINDLGIEGVSGDFFVNMEKRSIISRKGFDYRFKTYYTLNQIEDSLYNVDHTENSGVPTFKASYEFKGNNEYKIKITDIQYSGGYISKWDVLYKKDGDENWRTSRELEFTVEDYGTYKIKLRKDNIESAEASLNIAKGQQMILKAGQTAPKTMNATYFDGTDTATIPAGFTVSNIEGEKKVADGLVVYDLAGATISDWEANKETIRETYNQFVFVPVDGTNLKYEKHIYDTETVDDEGGSIEDTGNEKWRTAYYRKWNDWEDNYGDSDSVKQYGGFYIGRYEAGIPQNAQFYGNTDGASYIKTESANTGKDVTTYTPVSKKNQPVWNFISQVNAKTVSEKMYNNESVKSSLIDSYAWDTATTWMQNSGVNVADSSSWGNYLYASFNIDGLYALHTNKIAENYSKGTHAIGSGEKTEIATGLSDRNKSKNIYDFAGNINEWTTEVGTHEKSVSNPYVVFRGGEYGGVGMFYPACYRNGGCNNRDFSVIVGFRPVLYLKDDSLGANYGDVKDGLVLHFDAINNVGKGDSQHSNNTTTWKDLSGNNSDATITDATWTNNSIKLNNANSGITGVYANNKKNTDFTIEIVLNSYTESSNGAILYDFHTGGDQGYFATIYDNNLNLRFGATSYNYSYDFLNSVYPIKLTITCNKEQGRYGLSLNGKNVYRYSGSISIALSTSERYGILNNDNCDEGAYYGGLNSFKLYNRELTDREIKQNFEVDKQRYNIPDYARNGLIAHYDAINNTGIGQHDSTITTWHDLSGNGNHGTIYGISNNETSGWHGNHLSLDGEKDFVGKENITVDGQNATIEVVAKYISGTYMFRADAGGGRTYIYNDYTTKGYPNAVHLNFNGGNKYNIASRVLKYYTKNEKAYELNYFNMNKSDEVEFSGTENGNNIAIGSFLVKSPSQLAKMDVYAVRVYNRALSDEEIGYNYDIDKSRFGIEE